MKYVILRGHASNFLTVVMGTSPFTHKELAAAFSRTHVAVSAGFAEPLPDGSWRCFGDSMSLCMGPGADDARIIQAFCRATAQTAA